MRTLTQQLPRALSETRERTLSLIAGIALDDLERVHSRLLSPLVWDLGHVAAFEDLWIARTFDTALLAPDLIAVYDADETPRRDRGNLPYLRTAAALDYLRTSRARTLDLLEGDLPEEAELRLELIIRHDLQHNETMLQALQIAGLTAGLIGAAAPEVSCPGDGLELIPLAGGELEIGAEADLGFAYDNERPRHRETLASFEIGRTPVSNRAWQAFMEAGGYARRELWTAQGWAWREAEAVTRPLYWTASGRRRHFGAESDIDPDAPVCHVSCHEADAFAAFHDARLPTEFEWEAAATIAPVGPGRLIDGLRHSVWQWTSSTFEAYPGFRADPYPEYSEQFFGHGYRVLRGGAWLSAPRVATVAFRNWDLPERRQIFSGLRLARDL